MSVDLTPLCAYESLAVDYDEFTAAHDYDRLMGIYLGLAREHGLAGSDALDVGCGTGKSLVPLLDAGLDVVGCDVSPAMLARAAEKAPGVELHAADMTELRWTERFDLVTCVDDALNYLLDDAALEAAFVAAAQVLRPGGLYVFDVNTLRMHLDVVGRPTCGDQEGRFFAWEPRVPDGAGAGAVLDATLHVFADAGDGTWERRASTHRQRHHPLPAVRAGLAAAGLACLAVRGLHMTGVVDDEADESIHTKAIFVARKATRTTRGGDPSAPDRDASRGRRADARPRQGVLRGRGGAA